MDVPLLPPSPRDLVRRWSLRIACAVAWYGAGFAVDRLVCRAPETPATIQVAACIAFGILTCALLLEVAEIAGFPAQSKWEFLLPAAAYSLIWGRHHFLDFFYWDEIQLFGATPSSLGQLFKSLFQPGGSGNVMPLARAYWHVIFSVFRGDYIGKAGASFMCAIGAIASAHALLRIVAPQRTRCLTLVAATLLAATPHSPIVTLWKGADALVLSMSVFLPAMAALTAVVLGKLEFDGRVLAWTSGLLSASLLSSPMFAVVPIFLAPFAVWLVVGSPRARDVGGRFLALFLITFAATLGFWVVGKFLIGLSFPARPWTWDGLFGSLLGTLEMFLPARALVVVLALGSIAMVVQLAVGARNALRAPVRGPKAKIDPATIVWLLGVEMYLAGTLEVVLARGMVYETRESDAGYHLYLAFWGLALASASIVVAAGGALRKLAIEPRTRLARAATGTAVASALVVYCIFQNRRVERLWPVMTAFPLDNAWGLDLVQPGRTRITVIRAREEFREDLRRYVEGAVAIAEKDPRRRKLPDLALVDSPRFPELALWPQSMNVDPKFGQDYRSMSQLRFLMRVFGSSSWAGSRLPLRLLPLEAFDRAALTALYCDVATGPFLRKYWPQFEPDGKD